MNCKLVFASFFDWLGVQQINATRIPVLRNESISGPPLPLLVSKGMRRGQRSNDDGKIPPPPAFCIYPSSFATYLLDTSGAFPGKPRGGVSAGPVASHGGRAKGDHRAEEQAGNDDRHRGRSSQLEPHLQAAGLLLISDKNQHERSVICHTRLKKEQHLIQSGGCVNTSLFLRCGFHVRIRPSYGVLFFCGDGSEILFRSLHFFFFSTFSMKFKSYANFSMPLFMALPIFSGEKISVDSQL